MGRTGKIIGILIMLVFAGVLCSCTPRSYTKEQLESKTKELTPLAAKWFAENKQGATVVKSEVYSDGIDLLEAVKGSYKIDGKEYEFIYDVANDNMYLEEGYDQAVDIIIDNVADTLGVDVSCLKSSFCDMSFETKFAVSPAKGGNPIVIYSEKIPWGYSPEQFAKEVLSGETKLWFLCEVFNGTLNKNARGLMEALPNLISLTYNIPVDWDYSGINSIQYTSANTEYHYTVITNIDDVYCGYTYIIAADKDNTEFLPPEDISNPVVTKQDKQITVRVPYGAMPIIFEKGSPKMKLHYTVNGNSCETELYSTDKNTKSTYIGNDNVYDGYDEYMGVWLGRLFLPKSKMKCFYVKFVPDMFLEEYVITY